MITTAIDMNKELPYDDKALLLKIEALEQDIQQKREKFERYKTSFDDMHYYQVVLARLSFEFAKDEYKLLISEAIRRKLITG